MKKPKSTKVIHSRSNTPAAIAARKRYEVKRASTSVRLNQYLNPEEAAILARAIDAFGGTKKDGLMGALRFWDKYNSKFRKLDN